MNRSLGEITTKQAGLGWEELVEGLWLEKYIYIGIVLMMQVHQTNTLQLLD